MMISKQSLPQLRRMAGFARILLCDTTAHFGNGRLYRAVLAQCRGFCSGFGFVDSEFFAMVY